MDLFASLTVASVLQIPNRLRHRKWTSRSSRAKASSARTPALDVPEVREIPIPANSIIKTTTITHHFSYVDVSEERNRSHSSHSCRHSETVESQRVTYQNLPAELRIEIWNWVLVENKHPSLLWAVQMVKEWPAMFAFPVGNSVDEATIYTTRRRAPINTLLRLDEAAKYAVYRRFKPVPAGIPWQCTQNEFPCPVARPCRLRRDGQCGEWECPLEQAAGCQCGIIWVDPVQDVFVLPGSIASMMYTPRSLSTGEQRKSCRLHGGISFEGVDVIRNVLISSEAFLNRTVRGTVQPLQIVGTATGGSRLLWPLHDDRALAKNRAALLRLPSLKFVFLLVNDGMWHYDWKMTHWAFILRSRLHFYGQARNGPRDWLLGMEYTDTIHLAKKKWLDDFTECWASFAAKDVAYQCIFWNKDCVRDLYI